MDNADDCDDTNSNIKNGEVYFRDRDADGLGDPDSSIVLCGDAIGYVKNSDD